MSGRIHQRHTPAGNLRAIMHAIPWRFLILAPLVLVLAIPVFQYGMRVGQRLLPAITHFFYDVSGPLQSPAPTPLPSFPTSLPQAGVVLYTVQADESCDEILTMQMRMADAGQIFSDANPNTVKALDSLLGQDCHALQPGMIIRLAP